jgi:hypothetical protein
MEHLISARFVIVKEQSAREIVTDLAGVYGHEALSVGSEEMAQTFRQWESHLEDHPWSGRLPQNDLCESVRA